MSIKGYEPIPDVEDGVVLMIDNEKALTLLQTSPQEKYIQVSDKEAVELLCMLDDIIAINAMPKFDPPLLAVDSVEDDDDSSNDDSTVLLAAIKIPAMVFVVAVLGACIYCSIFGSQINYFDRTIHHQEI